MVDSEQDRRDEQLAMTYCKYRHRKTWLTASKGESKGGSESQRELKTLQEERKLLGRGHFVWSRSCIRPGMYSTTTSHQIQGHNKEDHINTRAHAGTHKLA